MVPVKKSRSLAKRLKAISSGKEMFDFLADLDLRRVGALRRAIAQLSAAETKRLRGYLRSAAKVARHPVTVLLACGIERWTTESGALVGAVARELLLALV